MYAVIKTGGKQYRVKPDDVLEIERLPGEAGDILEFDQVLMLSGDAGFEIGTPVISGAIVAAELVEQTRGDKIKVFKKKRRKHYRRTMGHRQDLSQIRITEILTGGAKPSKKAASKKKAPAKSEAKAVQTGKAEQPAPAVSEAAAEAPRKAPAKKAPARKAPARKTADKGDDLTLIAGIGPVIAKKLEGLGITTLKQIAALTPKKVAEIDEELSFKGRFEREEWIEQAKDLAAGKPPRAKSDKQD
jgi:large subunit ribosomal protein L21